MSKIKAQQADVLEREAAIKALLSKWDAEVKEHGVWTSGHSIAEKMAAELRRRSLDQRCVVHPDQVSVLACLVCWRRDAASASAAGSHAHKPEGGSATAADTITWRNYR